MDFSLLLPFAALLAAGAVAGFAGGLFGIGGGFVIVPALLVILPLLGSESGQIIHVAIGTSLASIIFTSLRSVTSHAARGAVDFATLRSWAPWVVLGTLIGAGVADRVSSDTLAVIFGVGILVFAVHFLIPHSPERQLASGMPRGAARAGVAGGIGLLSALLGIGGGSISTMVMTLCGVPIHRAIGTASGMGAIIAVPGAIGFMVIGFGEPGLPWGSVGYVNLPAFLALAVTSVLLAPLGVAMAHKLSPALLSRVFGIYLLTVGVLVIFGD